jgi:hypothetical protein
MQLHYNLLNTPGNPMQQDALVGQERTFLTTGFEFSKWSWILLGRADEVIE